MYRRSALEAVGGFPADVIGSEDAYVAARMLLAGWKVQYAASAQVYHSHDYRLMDEFHRYFDIGVFYGREPWIRQAFGDAGGEGKRYVLAELRALREANALHRAPKWWCAVPLNCWAIASATLNATCPNRSSSAWACFPPTGLEPS